MICPTSIRPKSEVELLDCTVRDGGFTNDFSFNEAFVRRHMATSSAIGCRYFEVGYLTDPSHLRSSDGFWRNVLPATIDTIRQTVRPDCKLSVMFDMWRYDARSLPPRTDTPFDLVRICTYHSQVAETLEACKRISRLGYEVSLNLICTSHIPSTTWGELRSRIDDSPFLDYLCLADSLGSLVPDDVKRACSYFHGLPGLRLGFHAHDNLRLAMANALAAIQSGIDLLDATYGGIGRGGGNLRLELIALYLRERHRQDLDLEGLFQHLDDTLDDLARAEFLQAMCGVLNVHPYRLRGLAHERLNVVYGSLADVPLSERVSYPTSPVAIER